MNNNTKRLRIFAGPNGSGKSTLVENLPKKGLISVNVFVNADIIEKEMNLKGFLSLYKYFRFKISTKDLHEYIRKFGILSGSKELYKLSVIRSRIYYNGDVNSYVAADIAGFIREQLLIKGKSFAFETVFSHESKLQIMQTAKDLGYRVYLYFITTSDPIININRVKIRVAENGHNVSSDKIMKRYKRSLDLLFDAIKLSSRAYIFDNSTVTYKLIAEITEGKKLDIIEQDPPFWFYENVIRKI